ncbi:hypothetical protein ACFQU7_14500 [Pseudoroseomonas wenyumeiae]
MRTGRGLMQAGRRLLRPAPGAQNGPEAVAGQDLAEAAKPGDMLLILGSPGSAPITPNCCRPCGRAPGSASPCWSMT